MVRTLAIVVALSSVAYAGDATWLLCKGVMSGADIGKRYVVVNLVEHRADAGRAVDVMFQMGMSIANGQVADAAFNGATGKLSVTLDKHAIFAGTSKLSQNMKTLELAGKFDFNWGAGDKPSNSAVTAKLTCDNLDDLAIGH